MKERGDDKDGGKKRQGKEGGGLMRNDEKGEDKAQKTDGGAGGFAHKRVSGEKEPGKKSESINFTQRTPDEMVNGLVRGIGIEDGGKEGKESRAGENEAQKIHTKSTANDGENEEPFEDNGERQMGEVAKVTEVVGQLIIEAQKWRAILEMHIRGPTGRELPEVHGPKILV